MYQTTENDEKSGDKQTVSEGLVPIQFYSLENTSKFCTEGSMKNLLNMVILSEHDVSMIWDLATAPLHSISERLHEAVPKIVCNHYNQVNSIQKCLWILWKQFNFIATKKVNCRTSRPSRIHYKFFKYVIFQYCSWSTAKNAVYDHVVVIWQSRVIDYESKNIYMLTKESLQQICGANTLFSHVSCGYGLFPPAGVRALSPEITNWGKDDYDDNKTTIRKFFNKK
jgi:hypothetical protein